MHLPRSRAQLRIRHLHLQKFVVHVRPYTLRMRSALRRPQARIMQARGWAERSLHSILHVHHVTLQVQADVVRLLTGDAGPYGDHPQRYVPRTETRRRARWQQRRWAERPGPAGRGWCIGQRPGVRTVLCSIGSPVHQGNQYRALRLSLGQPGSGMHQRRAGLLTEARFS